MNQSTENPEIYQQAVVDYSAYYQQQQQLQQQGYDPSSHYYHQPAIDYQNPYPYHQYGYSVQPIPDVNSTVQPQQHQEQEPTPPGVTAQQQAINHYYQYTSAPAAAAAPVQNVGAPYQSIVQSPYGGIGYPGGTYPQESFTAHSGSYPQESFIAHSGSYPQESFNSGSYPQESFTAHPGSNPNAFGRLFGGRGRGRGRGRSGRGQGHSIQTGPQHPTSSGPVPVAHRAKGKQVRVPQIVRCELCKVECDTVEMLELHKSGKKHHKNVKRHEELQNRQIYTQMEHAPASEFPVSMPFQGQSHSVPIPFQGHSHSVPVPPKLFCEVCKVDCNSLEILEKHKNGKKHIKNLKVYELVLKHKNTATDEQIEQKQEVPSEVEQTEGSGDPQLQKESLSIQAVNEETEVAAEKPNVDEIEKSAENTRMGPHDDGRRGFKRKLRGGKVNNRRMRPSYGSRMPMEPPMPIEAIPLICELCNVKCETQVVFQSHLMGKKHQSNAARFLGDPEILGQEILKALVSPAIQALIHQNNLNHQGFGSFHGDPAQNWDNLNVNASGSGTNVDNAIGEAANEPLTFSNYSITPNLVNTEGKSEGQLENRVEAHDPAGILNVAQMEGLSTGTEPIKPGTVIDGANHLEQSTVFLTYHGPDATTGQVPSEGGDSAQ